VPFLVVTLGAVHVFFPVDLSEPVSAIINDLMPRQEFLNIDAIVQTADKAGSNGLLTLTFIFALWTTSSFMGSLTQALHLVFSTSEIRQPRTGWRAQLYSITMVFIWSLFIALTALLFLIAPILETWLSLGLEIPLFQTYLIKVVRFAFLFVMFTTAFGVSYRLNAKRAISTRRCFEGGVLTTIGWLLAGGAFTHWLPAIWKQSIAFGALGSVVATLMWAYAAAWIVLLGAVYIVFRERRKMDF
jgi:YihY family inner membrane protein